MLHARFAALLLLGRADATGCGLVCFTGGGWIITRSLMAPNATTSLAHTPSTSDSPLTHTLIRFTCRPWCSNTGAAAAAMPLALTSPHLIPPTPPDP